MCGSRVTLHSHRRRSFRKMLNGHFGFRGSCKSLWLWMWRDVNITLQTWSMWLNWLKSLVSQRADATACVFHSCGVYQGDFLLNYHTRFSAKLLCVVTYRLTNGDWTLRCNRCGLAEDKGQGRSASGRQLTNWWVDLVCPQGNGRTISWLWPFEPALRTAIFYALLKGYGVIH